MIHLNADTIRARIYPDPTKPRSQAHRRFASPPAGEVDAKRRVRAARIPAQYRCCPHRFDDLNVVETDSPGVRLATWSPAAGGGNHKKARLFFASGELAVFRFANHHQDRGKLMARENVTEKAQFLE